MYATSSGQRSLAQGRRYNSGASCYPRLGDKFIARRAHQSPGTLLNCRCEQTVAQATCDADFVEKDVKPARWQLAYNGLVAAAALAIALVRPGRSEAARLQESPVEHVAAQHTARDSQSPSRYEHRLAVYENQQAAAHQAASGDAETHGGTLQHIVNPVATVAEEARLTEANGAAVNGADTAWVLMSTTLVLMMTLPGLALFYGGLARVGSVSSILLQHLGVASIVSIVWLAFGYSVAFSTQGMVEGEMGIHSVVGALDKAFLRGVSEGSVVNTIPEYLWVMFQMTFAIITPCIMLGAFVERMKFSAVMVLCTLWVSVVYLPIAHAVWAGPGSLLGDLGALDFAGGLVVHIASGFSGLLVALMVGKRKKNSMGVHSAPMVMIGTCLLWVGWMGFNVGSALEAGASAAAAMVATQAATAASALTWMLLDAVHGKPSLVGACTGALAGLVTITPAAGFVGPMGSMLMGCIGAIMCRWMVETVKPKLGYDDSLDAFGVHGMGGFVGNIIVGIFAHPLFGGNQVGMLIAQQLAVQTFSGFAVAIYSLLGTFVLVKLTSLLCGGLRVPADVEAVGTDAELAESQAYQT